MSTVAQFKEHLIGTLHSGSLNKVRNFEALLERAGNNVLSNCDPIDTERTTPLANLIHDDLYNYPLPTDFKKPIDLIPQDNRSLLDDVQRTFAGRFDLRKGLSEKTITIEGSEGSKFMRVNWKKQNAQVYHTMDSLTANGTWSVVGSATGLRANTVYKISGSASIEFDVVASGDGIQNTTAQSLDLTNEDEVADIIFPVYVGSTTNLTSITAIWGNDLTTKYWTGVAQTSQADGTAFRNGWNWIKTPWSTATETGTVTPSTIDSFKITVQATGSISNVRIDNILFSLGRPFDIKYYSKYFIKNTSGIWLQRTSSDDDIIVFDSDAINLLIYESIIEAAQQIEGEDSTFDMNYATKRLYGDLASLEPVRRYGLYAKYRGEFPSMAKKAITRWSSGPRFRR